jgi:hypothetical protein
MPKLLSPKRFAFIVGGVLFLFGLFQFAFRSNTRIPPYYLLLCILFGFWGLLSAMNKTRN